MKKFYQLSVFYAVLGAIGGVFFREFTKFNDFQGVTSLGVVHTHAFMLGMFFFLIVLLLEKQFMLSQHAKIKPFLYVYNIGLIVTLIMLIVRGVMETLVIELSSGMDAMISGFAGTGHILIGIGFIFFFKVLKDKVNDVKV